MKAFLKSPVIIAILAGIFLNLIGAEKFLSERPITGAIMATLQFLSNLTIPLILIIVGYGIGFDCHGVKDAFLVISIRLAILVPLALILNIVLIRGLLNLGRSFEVALFTLLILPPPFIVPLYVQPEATEEKRYINTVLTLYTVISVTIYAAYFIFNPQI